MSENQFKEMTYGGGYYQETGNFQRELYGEMGFVHGTVQEVDFLVDLSGLPDGARLLDFGCGTGRHNLEFARRGFRPVGAAAKQLNAIFHVGDVPWKLTS